MVESDKKMTEKMPIIAIREYQENYEKFQEQETLFCNAPRILHEKWSKNGT
jgi:hypothetical protein